MVLTSELTMEECKSILMALKITDAVILKKALKIRVIEIKMVQRKFSIYNIQEFIDKKGSR